MHHRRHPAPHLVLLAALPVAFFILLASSSSGPPPWKARELCELGLVARLLLDYCNDEPTTTMRMMDGEADRSGGHSTPHSTRHPPPSARPSTSHDERAELPYLFSPSSEAIPSFYSLDMSTQENYGVEDKEFHGPFKDIRAGLDFGYHGNYSKGRQEFQDKIVERMLDGTHIYDAANGRVCNTPTEPWIVFTAGVMGAGKSHTMKQLASRGLFPLRSYVIVDPDDIRQHFPEYHLYAQQCPKRAGELTHREAGFISEIVTAAAMQSGHNVLVDGSLRDYEWYRQYFDDLRGRYAKLRIAILHVVAPRDRIFERAASRAKETGRVIPHETLEESLEHVPISVRKLAPSADFFCELDNSTPGDVTLMSEELSWDDFRDNWSQTCHGAPMAKL